MNLTMLIRVLALALFVFTGWHLKGVQDERNALRVQVAAQQETLKLATRHSEVTTKVITQRVQSKAAIQQKAKDVQVEIEKRIPTVSSCSLPPDWRLLHDTAASADPIPEAPSGADGAPTSPKEAASTIADNYATYHDVADQLQKLQQWIEGVSK